MKTAIIYSRVSTKEQSNEKQKEQLAEFCEKNGYRIIATKEEKISGAATEKEELDKIIDGEPLADFLVIREISRLSRQEDVLDAALKVREILKKYTLVIVADNYVIEKGTKIGEDLEKLLLLIVRLFGAADERKKIAMRSTEARHRYAKNPEAYAAGSFPSIGFEKIENPNYIKGTNTKYLIQPGKDFEKVVQIFKLKAVGLSYAQVAKQVGVETGLIKHLLKNKRVHHFLPEELVKAAFEANKRNNSAPSPSKHDNIYKGIIFDGDTKYQMKQQATSIGKRYIKAGKGCITETDLNETVLKALQSFVRSFRISRNDVVEKNEKEIKQLRLAMESSQETLEKKQKEFELQEKKAINTSNMGLYDAIQKSMEKIQGEISVITGNINEFGKRINELENLEFDTAVVTLENLETYVKQYVKAVRYYPVRKFCRIIRVEIKEEYLPNGANNYRDYEVYSCRETRYIIPLEFKMANDMLKMRGVDTVIEDENDYWSVNPQVYYKD